MSYRYLASPYTHSSAVVRELRYRAAEYFTAQRLRQRIWTYSPIVHCHTIATAYDLPRDFDFWHEYAEAMIQKAERLEILRLPGWENSRGIQGEVAFAKEHNIPITFAILDNDDLAEALSKLA